MLAQMSTQRCMKEVPKTPFLRESAKPYGVVVQIGADGAKARLSRDHLTIAKVDVMIPGTFQVVSSQDLLRPFHHQKYVFQAQVTEVRGMSRPFILSSMRLF